METSLLSPRRIIHWSNAVVSEKLQYFPAPSTDSSHVVTDKYMDSRIAVFLEGMLQVPHRDLLNDDNKLHQLGLIADLPDNVIKVCILFVRGMFELDGKLSSTWRDFQKDMRRPEKGWYELITRWGFFFGESINKGEFVEHPDSQLGDFFKTYYLNHKEYAGYFELLKEKIAGGDMVTILKPREYFKAKAKGDPLDGSKPKETAADAGVAMTSR